MEGMGILFFWWVGSLIYFKVACDFGFGRHDLSVISAMLLGVMIAASVYVTSYFYSIKMGQHLARIHLGRNSSYFSKAFWIWSFAVIANIIVGKAIVFGFSKDFNKNLGGELLF